MFGKRKCNRKLLGRYPCDTHLKEALRFIDLGRLDDAYIEICYVIAKSGGELSDYEFKRYCELRYKE
jgi:hypothetical protein